MRIKTLAGPDLQSHLVRSIEGQADLTKRLIGKTREDKKILDSARTYLQTAARILQMVDVKLTQDGRYDG